MNKLSIRDLDMAGKRVFIRVDFNVPLDGNKVTDDTRIRETLPTLKLAADRGARLVLASHLGRPKGKVNPKYSLAPVAAKLKELLGKPVDFASDCIGAEAESKSKALGNGGVLLLETTRRSLRSALRLRRVRFRASRSRFGRGHHEIREAVRGRLADGKRARL